MWRRKKEYYFWHARFKYQTKQCFLSVGPYSPLQGRHPGKLVSSGDSLGTDHPASPISTLLGSAWIRRRGTMSQFQMLFSKWSAMRSGAELGTVDEKSLRGNIRAFRLNQLNKGHWRWQHYPSSCSEHKARHLTPHSLGDLTSNP